MLYQVDDLRVVVETAKRLLTKEQMDKMARQSSTSPFMQVNQGSPKGKDKMEKKVSFSTVEAMKTTTDSIERLASLMDKMDTKLDRREDQYRPRIYQGRSRGCSYRQNKYGSRNRSYSRDWYQNSYRGREKLHHRDGNRNYRSSYRDNSRSRDRNSYRDGNRYNNRSNYKREDSSQTRTVADPGIEIEIGGIGVAPEKAPNLEAVPKIDMKTEGRVEMMPEIETGLNLDLDPLLM